MVVAANPTSDLPKLPDTARQAADLRTLYGAARTQLFVGDEATEPRVRAAAAGAWVLHFATHGVVDDTNPMYSFLQLTRTGPAEAATDGRLEAWEILSMHLDASVAVLTACDTARGTIGGGEGVISLAVGLLRRGDAGDRRQPVAARIAQCDGADPGAPSPRLRQSVQQQSRRGRLRVCARRRWNCGVMPATGIRSTGGVGRGRGWVLAN